MKVRKLFLASAAAVCLASASLLPASLSAQPTAVSIDNDDIGGVVSGPNGPEAGVWVIAETTDLPTRKSVAATSSPISPRPATRSLRAATGFSTRRRSASRRAGS